MSGTRGPYCRRNKDRWVCANKKPPGHDGMSWVKDQIRLRFLSTVPGRVNKAGGRNFFNERVQHVFSGSYSSQFERASEAPWTNNWKARSALNVHGMETKSGRLLVPQCKTSLVDILTIKNKKRKFVWLYFYTVFWIRQTWVSRTKIEINQKKEYIHFYAFTSSGIHFQARIP